MKKRYPRTLSSGANNTVIALSETEVGKLFTGDTRSDIGSEAEKMKFANAVNGLIVRFVRLDEWNAETEMLVMERLFPMDFRAYEQEKRELWLDILDDELTQLHKAGFVHRDDCNRCAELRVGQAIRLEHVLGIIELPVREKTVLPDPFGEVAIALS